MSEIEDDLKELEHRIKRLRLEYEQYFLGILKREPWVLKSDVQRRMNAYLSHPPTRSREKFRFNTLCARYQSYRALWSRTMQQIENGTYHRHLFRARVQGQGRAIPPKSAVAAPKPPASGVVAGVDKLYKALAVARRKTGEGMQGMTPEKLAATLRHQTETLRKKHGSGKVRFRIVVEGNRARLRATVKS
ncbi:MAG: MXAN_5187 C-terminal domain-containing protein [Myxococcota bacterium]